jgi:hypothetical protein
MSVSRVTFAVLAMCACGGQKTSPSAGPGGTWLAGDGGAGGGPAGGDTVEGVGDAGNISPPVPTNTMADAADATDEAQFADPCAALLNRQCDPPDAGMTCHVQVLECPGFQHGGYSLCVCEPIVNDAMGPTDAAGSGSAMDASSE